MNIHKTQAICSTECCHVLYKVPRYILFTSAGARPMRWERAYISGQKSNIVPPLDFGNTLSMWNTTLGLFGFTLLVLASAKQQFFNASNQVYIYKFHILQKIITLNCSKNFIAICSPNSVQI